MNKDDLLFKAFIRLHPHDAALTIERLPEAMTVELLEDITPELAASIFENMQPVEAAKSIQLMAADRAALILAQMSAHVASRMLRKIPTAQCDKLMNQLEVTKRLGISRQLKYPGDTVGAIMNPYVFTLPHDITVAEALKRIEREQGALECDLYVVDEQHKFIGIAYASALLRARKNQLLGSLAVQHIPVLPAQASLQVVQTMPQWLDHQSLPVVEKDGALIGVLMHVDVQNYQLDVDEGSGAESARKHLSLVELCWLGLAELSDLLYIRHAPGKGGRA
jgi:Mg/Co/Ni transporter MgtE